VVTQFKMFSFTNLDKVYIQGYKNADANQQKLAWATAQLIGAMPLAFGAMWLENMTMGKSMPDLSKMSLPQAEKFLIELSQPGLSLFMGVLDPRHQNADMIWSLLGSPTSRLIGNALSTLVSLSQGNLKAAKKHFKDTMSYVLPINTTPLLSPMVRQAMGEKGYLEPGQKHYFGR